MPPGKTWSALWFSSMITRILLIPPAATWTAAGGLADERAGTAWEELAGDGLACPAPQPAARQPTTAAPASRTARRRADVLGSGRPAGGVAGSGAAGPGDA